MNIKKIVTVLASTFFVGAAANAACPNFSKSLGNIQGKEACQLDGKKFVDSDLLLTSDKLWVLKGAVFIGNDNKGNSTITLQPGTKVIGQSGADYLVITRGSKIFAEGTANKPIVFTSAKTTNRARGDWGGLIINGNAPINGCGLEKDPVGAPARFCESQGEGNSGLYGGNNPEDNSGVLKYVRVEYAGNEITPDNELNGIAFQGVGSETVVDYIQVHMNADDGVEFFGGTVNAKHIVLTGNKDDSLDWTKGWVGKAQFVVIQQYDDQGNNGIEADNLGKVQDSIPRSQPILSNMTFLGTSSEDAKGGEGILLRKGTGAHIFNTVVSGFKKSCFDIDDKATFENADKESGIVVENMILNCSAPVSKGDDDLFSVEAWFLAQFGNMMADPLLNGWVPAANSPVHGNGEAPLDIFFDEVDFIGAIESADEDWTKGWTTSDKN